MRSPWARLRGSQIARRVEPRGDAPASRGLAARPTAEGKRVSTAESTAVESKAEVAVEVDEFTAEIADQIESFLIALGAVARGDFPGGSLSMLLLEVSQLMLAGGRLGAVVDVVPPGRFEPDAGPDPDADGLRELLASS